jgi:hypothetical protein
MPMNTITENGVKMLLEIFKVQANTVKTATEAQRELRQQSAEQQRQNKEDDAPAQRAQSNDATIQRVLMEVPTATTTDDNDEEEGN